MLRVRDRREFPRAGADVPVLGAQCIVLLVIRLRGQAPAAAAQRAHARGRERAVRGEHLAEFERAVQAARQGGHDAGHDGVGGRGLAREHPTDGGARHAHVAGKPHLSPERVPRDVEHDRADAVVQRALEQASRQGCGTVVVGAGMGMARD